MRQVVASCLWLVVSLLVALPAHAAEVTPELEVATGATQPLGASRYAGDFDTSLKLGVRAVAYLGRADATRHWRLGGELALDLASMDWPAMNGLDMRRWRGLIGGRGEFSVTPHFQLFTRALVGVDHYRSATIQFQPPGEPTQLAALRWEGSALALELGVGATLQFGKLMVGVQCGVPVAFHETKKGQSRGLVLSNGVEQPVSEQAVARGPISTTTYDLDVLATLGLQF